MSDTEVSRLTDEELVAQARGQTLQSGVLAEMARRQLRASADLKDALKTTSSRLYWLTAVLTIYTVGLFVAAVAALLLRTK